MLGSLKKTYELVAPVSGKILDLADVPDEVFAQRLVGDGVAIDATGDVIVSPADGELSLLFKTYHAFGLTLDNGTEILVHIGIDTVKLQGEGFQALSKQGRRVKKGDPIVRINRDFIKNKGYSLIMPVLITNLDSVCDIQYISGIHVEAGKDNIYTYNMK